MLTTGPAFAPRFPQANDRESFSLFDTEVFDSNHRLPSPLYPIDMLSLDSDIFGLQEFSHSDFPQSELEFPSMDDCFSSSSMTFDPLPLDAECNKSEHHVDWDTLRMAAPFHWLNRDVDTLKPPISPPHEPLASNKVISSHTVCPPSMATCDLPSLILSPPEDSISDADSEVDETAEKPVLPHWSMASSVHSVPLPPVLPSTMSSHTAAANIVQAPRRSTRITPDVTSPISISPTLSGTSHHVASARRTRKTTPTETPRQAFDSLHRNSQSPRHASSSRLETAVRLNEPSWPTVTPSNPRPSLTVPTFELDTQASSSTPSLTAYPEQPAAFAVKTDSLDHFSSKVRLPASPVFEETSGSLPVPLKRGRGEADLDYDEAGADDESEESDAYVPNRRKSIRRRKRGSGSRRRKPLGPKSVCDDCDATFTRKADLTRHKSTVHTQQTAQDIRADRDPETRRWCLGCLKILARPDARSRHEDNCVEFRQRSR